jgi:hypothetical protein
MESTREKAEEVEEWRRGGREYSDNKRVFGEPEESGCGTGSIVHRVEGAG